MQSTNPSSPLKPSTSTPSKSIGPYRTIITTYAPFTTLRKNSKAEDSPIKKVKPFHDDKLIKSTKLIKPNRELSKSYSKSSDKIIVKDVKDESQYIGSYNGKVREGFGKLFNAQGILVYEGQWFNDQQHGNGILYNHDVNAQFTKYVGQFQFGYKYGAAIEYYRDGSMYVGNFESNCRNGMGQLTKKNGEKLNGLWLKGILISRI
ncbi:unnamed protein product (macronuclear) [Paramecium tetraurelia]|uniref:MORN repeat-containing protein 3 n=1 Tax=Paramecium tetraurelia TaxID=5888 RepID=A0EH54_PARTE|nr:uncharacterized protein GSPATT00026969001 [Paramecium tetraurelia]CAK94645.1 unnamed protein product [Paramecium tetraurelia]|eukprot:XP_001462018.1 hypothetical protein (macronuclear) [Paramecium tetraurelia strain d4-2]